MPTKNLTDSTIRKLPKPAKRTDYRDGKSTGLILRVNPTGTKTWRVRYMRNGKINQMTIGRYPTLSLAEARQEAHRHHEAIRSGDNPAEKHRKTPSVEEFTETYIERKAKVDNKDWRNSYNMLAKDVIPFIGTRKLDKVTRAELMSLVDRVRDRGAYVHANRLIAVMSTLFNFAVSRGVIENSPAYRLPKTKETSRDKVLDDNAIRLLWRATAPLPEAEKSLHIHHCTRLALRLLLITGARNGEVSGIRLDEIDFDKRLWTLPKERSKNGRSNTLPLSDLALETIDAASEFSDGFLFPTGSKQGHLINDDIAKAMRRIFASEYTPHDLRRTAATRISQLGFNRLVLDKIQNHVDSSMSGVYDRHDYMEEKRQALSLWSAELQEILKVD